MKKSLLDARRKFKGQKAVVGSAGGFDNSPFMEGKHTFKVMESAVKEGGSPPRDKHYMRLRCEDGADKGKGAFPFSPYLDTADGISASATNVQRILGDVVPGTLNRDNEFVTDLGEYLEVCEGLFHQCIGQLIEVTVKNQKPNPKKAPDAHINKNTGKPYQNFYINRGLGDDADGIGKGSASSVGRIDPDDDLSFGDSGKPPVTKKKVAKKKVAKKKVVKKKVVKKKR
jgi:hypothetical protein